MDMDKNDIKEEVIGKKLYEIGYLIVPVLSPEDVKKEEDIIKDIIKKENGEVVLEGAPKKIELAYKISKVISNKKSTYENGYFGWIKFKIDRENILKINETLRLETNILRFLIISTIIPQEPTRKIYKPKPIKKEIRDVELKPIDEGAVDREIEKLLVE